MTEDYMDVFREQAHFVLLGYASDAERRDKPHIANSERMLAQAVLRGEIDEGKTITDLMQPFLQEKQDDGRNSRKERQPVS